ncbi:hypothetical protein protein [Bacillus cereus G9241]|nr:hypothetical protein protein [Bacillus cereus G9241]
MALSLLCTGADCPGFGSCFPLFKVINPFKNASNIIISHVSTYSSSITSSFSASCCGVFFIFVSISTTSSFVTSMPPSLKISTISISFISKAYLTLFNISLLLIAIGFPPEMLIIFNFLFVIQFTVTNLNKIIFYYFLLFS